MVATTGAVAKVSAGATGITGGEVVFSILSVGSGCTAGVNTMTSPNSVIGILTFSATISVMSGTFSVDLFPCSRSTIAKPHKITTQPNAVIRWNSCKRVTEAGAAPLCIADEMEEPIFTQ